MATPPAHGWEKGISGIPQAEANSSLEDIFVPGLGVRDALDDDRPQPSPVWPRALQRYRSTTAKLRVLTVILNRIFRNSQAVWSRMIREIKITLRPKISVNLVGRRIRALQAALIVRSRSAVITLQARARKQWLKASGKISGIPKQMRLKFLDLRPMARVPISRAAYLAPHVSKTAAGATRRLQAAGWVLSSATSSLAVRCRAIAIRKPRLHVPKFYWPSLAKLRRAASAIAILLVMVLFVIEEIIATVKR